MKLKDNKMQLALQIQTTLEERVHQLERDLQKVTTGANIHKINGYRQILISSRELGKDLGIKEVENFLTRTWRKKYGRNRRKHTRVDTNIQTTCFLSDNAMITGITKNISAGGACFQPETGYVDGVLFGDSESAMNFFEQDDIIQIQTNGNVSLSVVRWIGEDSIGIQFAQEKDA
jgi:hypothetical protein